MNNVACSRLRNMLHLDILKGEEAMKTPTFQNDISETLLCMKILMMSKKGVNQLTSNDTYFDDRWFSGLKWMRRQLHRE